MKLAMVMKTGLFDTGDQIQQEGVPKFKLDGNFQKQALCQLNMNALALNANHLSVSITSLFFIFPDFIQIFGEKRVGHSKFAKSPKIIKRV